jgi:hypothetical protein
MKINSIALALVSFALLSHSMSADATPSNVHGQRCELGATCSIPGNDSGITYFSITPKSGLSYQCNVNAQDGDGKLKFYVASGKDFHIITGDDVYTAAPFVSINVVGNFEKPTDENDDGQIKFVKISGDDASVTCNIAS